MLPFSAVSERYGIGLPRQKRPLKIDSPRSRNLLNFPVFFQNMGIRGFLGLFLSLFFALSGDLRLWLPNSRRIVDSRWAIPDRNSRIYFNAFLTRACLIRHLSNQFQFDKYLINLTGAGTIVAAIRHPSLFAMDWLR